MSRPSFRHKSNKDTRRRPPPEKNNGPKGRVVVGLHAVRELLKVRPQAITQLWVREGYRSSVELLQLVEFAEKVRVRPTLQSAAALDRITGSHQGVIAFASAEPELNFQALEKAKQSTLLVLDEVEDPHNLGAVLRTAWLFGAHGLLLPETRSASHSPAVSKVAQGAVEHVPIWQDSGLLETLKRLKSQGFWLFGLSHKGEGSLYKTEIPEKVIWVLGSESSGIRKPIERECDQLIKIPQVDPEASFNVSVAAAIALSETYRQRL